MSPELLAAASAPLHAVLRPAGPEAASIASLAGVLFAGGTVLFAAVLVLLAVALRGPRPVRAARWVLGGGVALPAVLLSALLAWSAARSRPLAAPTPPGALVVGITARMWWWELRYRDPASGREVITANELRLPVGRPVHLGLTSADVIHSVWLPSLAGKMDLVPGRVNRLLLSVDAPGVHRGACAEYCGTQHARMALHVVAQAPQEFDAWLARQARPAEPPATPLLAHGRRLFGAARCGACHALREDTAEPPGRPPLRRADDAAGGPDLTHVGARLHLGAGVLRNDAAAMRAWIADVQAHKPGARMPSFAHLEPGELEPLAAYLAQLR